jgi:hypothetical protein
MITEKQLKNFKGMRDYEKLKLIQDQLMKFYDDLYDMECDTQEVKKNVIYLHISVGELVQGLEA